MVIDTSAILAILRQEPEARAFAALIAEAGPKSVSAVSHVECSILAVARRGDVGVRELDLFFAKADIEVAPFDRDQAGIARNAFVAFGKGRHPAALNFGDCCSYALAAAQGEPLLFKGNDFSKTDITAAFLPDETSQP